MLASENQHTERMRGDWHAGIKDWERRAGELVGDLPEAPVVPSIEAYERLIGRALLNGEIQAEEAVRALRNYEVWFVAPPTSIAL